MNETFIYQLQHENDPLYKKRFDAGDKEGCRCRWIPGGTIKCFLKHVYEVMKHIFLNKFFQINNNNNIKFMYPALRGGVKAPHQGGETE